MCSICLATSSPAARPIPGLSSKRDTIELCTRWCWLLPGISHWRCPTHGGRELGWGVLEGEKIKLVVNVSMPTDWDLTTRQPDIMLYLKEHNQIVILEVAVAWEPLLEERGKAQKVLAADLVIQHPGWKVDVMAIVVGSLGTLHSFRGNIGHLKLFSKREVLKFSCNVQFKARLFHSTVNLTTLQHRNVTMGDARMSTLLLTGIFWWPATGVRSQA